MPSAIVLMASALGISLVLAGLDVLGLDFGLHDAQKALLERIDFARLLLQGMLSMLLFAGALHVDMTSLRAYRSQVAVLAFAGTAASAALIGAGMWLLLQWVGLAAPLAACLLFGALISPTDPIAVLDMLKSARAPRELEAVIAGESLFNDGVGVVLFAALLPLAAGQGASDVGSVVRLLLQSTGGGLVFGWLIGRMLLALLRRLPGTALQIAASVTVVLGGYALADRLGLSGPLAMVVTGLLVGEAEHARLARFWDAVDELLNAVLFVLVGMEAVALPWPAGIGRTAAAAAGTLGVVLAARWVTVGLPVDLWRTWFRLPRGAGGVLTWGGLRGAISLALALAMPAGAPHQTFIALTYAVVVFSILVQGLSFGRYVRRTLARPGPTAPARSGSD